MSTQNEDFGPGLTPAILLGILTLLLGMALGVASLVSQPVVPVSKVPEPGTLKSGTVYYAKGARLGRTAWEAKEEAWKAGTVSVLAVSEAELNQWSQNRLDPSGPVGTEVESGWTSKFNFTALSVNFLILEDTLQIATELRMEGLFPNRSFVYIVRGKFESAPDGSRFVPEKGTLGSAALGSVPSIRNLLFSRVASKYSATGPAEWLPESMEKVDSVEIADGKLILRRRAEG